MEGKIIKQSLLNAYAAADVVTANGIHSITGLMPIRQGSVIRVDEIASAAEVQQVVTVTTPTIVAATRYALKIGNTGLRVQGWQQVMRTFAVTSPAILSGVAATDKQNVVAALVAKINASGLPVVAAAAGDDMTITDNPNYYKVNYSRLGATAVLARSGYVQSNIVVTTPAVYSQGLGTRMLESVPVTELTSGNLAQGTWGFPTNNLPIAGDTYQAFLIVYEQRSNEDAKTDFVHGIEASQLLYLNKGDADYAAVRTLVLALV